MCLYVLLYIHAVYSMCSCCKYGAGNVNYYKKSTNHSEISLCKVTAVWRAVDRFWTLPLCLSFWHIAFSYNAFSYVILRIIFHLHKKVSIILKILNIFVTLVPIICLFNIIFYVYKLLNNGAHSK